MGGAFAPQTNESDRTAASDFFSTLIAKTLGGKVDLPGLLQQAFTTPQYTGPLGAGPSAAQQQILDLTGQTLSRYFGGGYNPAQPAPTGSGTFPGQTGGPRLPYPGQTTFGPQQTLPGATYDPVSTGMTFVPPAANGGSGIQGYVPGTEPMLYGGSNNLPLAGETPEQTFARNQHLSSGGSVTGTDDVSRFLRGEITWDQFSANNKAQRLANGDYNIGDPSLSPAEQQQVLNAKYQQAVQMNMERYGYSQQDAHTAALQQLTALASASGASPETITAISGIPLGGFQMPAGATSAGASTANSQSPIGTFVPLPGTPANPGGATDTGGATADKGNIPIAGRPIDSPVPGANSTTFGIPAEFAQAVQRIFNPNYTGATPTTPLAQLPQFNSAPAVGAGPNTQSISQGFQNFIQGLNNPAYAQTQGLNSIGFSNPTGGIQNLLLGRANQDVLGGANGALGQAQGLIGQLAQLPQLSSLLGGQSGATDFGNIYSALDAQRRQGLQQDFRDIREQFSSAGLRRSTDLANALTNRQTQSETGMNATLAGLIPQLAGQNLQGQQTALSFLGQLPGALSGIGSTAGQLSLGQQQNQLGALSGSGSLGQGNTAQQIQALLGGGQLGLGSSGQSLQALLAAPGATQTLAQLPYALQQAQQGVAAGDIGLLGQGYNLNELARTANDTNAVRGQQAYQQTQSLFPQLLAFLSGAPAPDLTPSPFSQGANLALGAGSLAAGVKNLK